MEALWKYERSDVAFDVTVQKSYPSWGHMLYEKGSTTPFEYWNGRGSDNHPFLMGGLGRWVYKGVAGISPLKPGFEECLIKPEVVGDLTWAKGTVAYCAGPNSYRLEGY